MKQKGKRRLYPVVNRSHQYRFLAIILTYNLIIVAFLMISLFVPEIIKMQDEGLSFAVRAAAADRVLTMHMRLWPAMIALICFIGLHSFRVFHRFIGPLFRFTRAFEQIRNGDLNFSVKLRKKDYLHREEESLNMMIDVLAERIRESQLSSEDALRSLEELEGTSPSEDSWYRISKEHISALRRNLDGIFETLNYFKI